MGRSVGLLVEGLDVGMVDGSNDLDSLCRLGTLDTLDGVNEGSSLLDGLPEGSLLGFITRTMS